MQGKNIQALPDYNAYCRRDRLEQLIPRCLSEQSLEFKIFNIWAYSSFG